MVGQLEVQPDTVREGALAAPDRVTAQGIVVFMVFGGGLTAGLLAQIGNAIDSDSLHTIGRIASWALPFEGLYAAGLHALISETSGLTGVVLQLGPFGGSEAAGPQLIGWAVVYLAGAWRSPRWSSRGAISESGLGPG